MRKQPFDLIENYIYIYQLDKYIIIPVYPEQISDSLGSKFASVNPLSRTAPIYAYSYAGPRSVQISLNLHRDFMTSVNIDNTDFLDKDELTDDYVDTLIKYLQAMALPSFKATEISNKMVNPPMIAVRFGNQVFIKGIVNGDVAVTYSGTLDMYNRYQEVAITFNVCEVDPYDADTIAKWGSFRGLETALTKNMYKKL